MCLGVPACVQKIAGEWGWVDVNRLRMKVNLSLVDGVAVGDYVIVHAGFAIQKMSREEGESTLEVIRQLLEVVGGE